MHFIADSRCTVRCQDLLICPIPTDIHVFSCSSFCYTMSRMCVCISTACNISVKNSFSKVSPPAPAHNKNLRFPEIP